MNVTAMAKGVSAGMITGAAVYAASTAKSSKKRKLKSRVAKAVYAMGDIAEEIADFMS